MTDLEDLRERIQTWSEADPALLANALDKVLDLHQPTDGLPGTGQQWCLICWQPGIDAMGPAPYPCPTVQAITAALDQPPEDDTPDPCDTCHVIDKCLRPHSIECAREAK